MNLINNTDSSVFWSVTSPGQADCGTLGPRSKTYFPAQPGPIYDVSFTPTDPKWFAAKADAGADVAISMTSSSAKGSDNS